MCGICGYIGDGRYELLKPMCEAMAHRGPDDEGIWYSEKDQVGLGHRRLSIIDLSPAGHQPMSNENGQIWISYNGEIYNYQELRDCLIQKGHRFRGHSDTEVLVHLYEEKGLDFVNELNGIFALAIWDGKGHQLILARDHAGVKPLYYWWNGSRLFFASEIKALFRVPEIPREVKPKSVHEFLTFLWVPGQNTILKGIKKIEPGHCLVWKDGRIEVKRWFNLKYEPDYSVGESEWIERVHDTFMRTTRRQMVSDVPLGAFLSGGLDSSSIVTCMRKTFPERKIRCYTAVLDPIDMVRDKFENDYPYAKKVAELMEVDLKSFVLKTDVISLLPKMVYHLDEPDADPAVFPSYLISKYAREDGTIVLLSGTGGDEVFFGYRSHQAYRYYARLRWLPRWLSGPALKGMASLAAKITGAQTPLARRVTKFCRGLLQDGLPRHLEIVDWSDQKTRLRLYSSEFAATLTTPDEPPESMEKYFNTFSGTGDINRHTHILIQTFLAAHNFLYTDKSSMATSVEVRVPFMDIELMKLCAKIPEEYKLKGIVTKSILKKAMRRYLPGQILYRGKTGFGAPLRKWIAEDLKPVINTFLSTSRLKNRGFFNPRVVKRIIEDNSNNKADHAYLIYALLTLELWQQTYIDRAGEEVNL